MSVSEHFQAIFSSNAQLMTAIFAAIPIVLLFQRYKVIRARNPQRLSTPPGPRGLPFIGSFLDMPREKHWITYSNWCKTHGTGDMVYFTSLGQPYLILNTLERVSDLLEKRSSNYSDRPRLPMLIELMGWDSFFAQIPYGNSWRHHRRMFNQYFNQNAVKKYQPVISRETTTFLQRLLVSPEKFLHHIRHTFAASIMDISYGIKVQQAEDPYISRAEIALDGLAVAGIFGTFLVDFIPVLKYIPSWCASFRRKANLWRKTNEDVLEIPFKHVEERMKNGTAKPCVSVSLIERYSDAEDRGPISEQRRIAKEIAAMSYLGGADTTVSSIQSFFLAMTLYPEVQRKAQAEIDKVVGKYRLPDPSHRPDLPYIESIMKEVSRWNLVTPLAVGHMCTADDEYGGYFIPAGTIVLGNAWAILNDPDIYPEPEKFMPERFMKNGKLNPNVRDPNVAVFGFGRRICPGRHLSDLSLYSMVSSILAVYDIKPAPDRDGKREGLQPLFTSGLLTYPLPFKCEITPRSPEAAKSINKTSVEI